VIQRSLDSDTWLINIGSQYSTSVRTVKIASRYNKGVYAVVGLHPIHLNDDITESVMIDGVNYEITTKREEFDYDKYKELAQSSDRVVGLGETGLDYFYFKDGIDTSEHKKIQKDVFKEFIKMAGELDLPLVIHCRGSKDNPDGAYDDILEILKENDKIRGVIHCFGGNMRQAKEFVELGFYIGFTGIVTFKKKSEEIAEIARELPMDKILIETDAPFLSPEPHRGKRNEPEYVKFVASKISELRNIKLDEVASATVKNTLELFKL
jgi:TatD DNase family protein